MSSCLAHVNPCCSVNSHTDHMTTLLHASVASCLTYNPDSLTWSGSCPLLWRHHLCILSKDKSQPHSPLFYPLTSKTQGCSRTLALTFPPAGKRSSDRNKSSLLLSARFSSRVSLPAYFYMKSRPLPKLLKQFLQNICHLKFFSCARLLFFFFDPGPHILYTYYIDQDGLKFKRSACLCLQYVGIEVVQHYTCPVYYLLSFNSQVNTMRVKNHHISRTYL